MPPELEPKFIPAQGLFLYTVFWDLYRQEGMSWTEIEAYQRIYGIVFSGEDLSVLRSLFSKAMDWKNKEMKNSQAKTELKQHTPKSRKR